MSNPYGEMLGTLQTLGRVVQDARERRDLTLTAAAQEIGISLAKLSILERSSKPKYNSDSLLLILRWLAREHERKQ